MYRKQRTVIHRELCVVCWLWKVSFFYVNHSFCCIITTVLWLIGDCHLQSSSVRRHHVSVLSVRLCVPGRRHSLTGCRRLLVLFLVVRKWTLANKWHEAGCLCFLFTSMAGQQWRREETVTCRGGLGHAWCGLEAPACVALGTQHC